ncbi:MAG TPA: hypothetical protein VF322_13650 [Gammaproteobacteria bacterium]
MRGVPVFRANDVNRSMTRSAAFSVALHALLVAPLLLLVRFEPSVVTSFSGMRVQWVELAPGEPGAEQTPSAAVEAPEEPIAERVEVPAEEPPVEAETPAPTEERAVEELEPAETAEPAVAAAEPAGAEAPAEPTQPSVEPAEARAEATQPPAEASEAPPEPIEAEPREAPAEIVLAERPPEPSEQQTEAPATAETVPPLAAEEPALAPAVVEQPVATPIPRRQREMLAEHIADLARDERRLAPGAELEWTEDGQRYTATVTHLPARDDTALDHLIVAVSTEQDGERLSTEMRLKRLAFSHFAHFVDRWDPRVQIHDDEIDGRFHSNSDIRLARENGVQPRFLGKVTTARGIDTSSSEQRVRRDQVFLGGLETRVGRIPLPPQALAGMPDADGSVHEFREDTRIEFRADGTFAWRPIDGPGPERVAALSADATYLLGAEDVKLHVRGVVNGKVLVYSADDIVIEDDLTYAADPRSFGADDYLGLVAEKNVEIAPPDVTGPGDLTVQAAIYAKRRFAVTRYSAREHATLSIYGSVTAGSVTATEPRYGTKLVFDDRFADARPPRFPVTGRFELTDWDAAWRGQPLDAYDGAEEAEAAEAAAVTSGDGASGAPLGATVARD